MVGPSGTGKTTLCHVLREELGDQLRVVFLASGRLSSRRALLQAILYELGQPYRGLDEGEARLAAADYITLSDECPNGILLLVDEAHTLPLRLLDEVRMTTNLAHQGKPWVRVVLVGSSALEERFASPKLDSFNQRIAARCYLESFGATETQQYIWTQIDMAGGVGKSLFPEATCKAVYHATDGVPRLVNQVCDHALLLACAAGHKKIHAAHIEEAWADLQQLPTPWNGEAPCGGDAGGVIEFGQLDDEGDLSSAGEAESPDTIPVLRISEPSDELADRQPSIEDGVDRIAKMLDQVETEETDFEPAGSIGPEVELHFNASWDPFGEDFAEEETVEDGPEHRAQFKQQVSEAPAAESIASAECEPVPSISQEELAHTDAVPVAEEALPIESSADVEEPAASGDDSDESQFRIVVQEFIESDAMEPLAATASTSVAEEEQAEPEERTWAVLDAIEDELAAEQSEAQPSRPASPCRPTPCRPTPPARPKFSRLFASLRQA